MISIICKKCNQKFLYEQMIIVTEMGCICGNYEFIIKIVDRDKIIKRKLK